MAESKVVNAGYKTASQVGVSVTKASFVKYVLTSFSGGLCIMSFVTEINENAIPANSALCTLNGFETCSHVRCALAKKTGTSTVTAIPVEFGPGGSPSIAVALPASNEYMGQIVFPYRLT